MDPRLTHGVVALLAVLATVAVYEIGDALSDEEPPARMERVGVERMAVERDPDLSRKRLKAGAASTDEARVEALRERVRALRLEQLPEDRAQKLRQLQVGEAQPVQLRERLREQAVEQP